MGARADADLVNTQTPIGQVAFPEVVYAESWLWEAEVSKGI